MNKFYKLTRQIVLGIVGFIVLILGFLMLVLPGPGILVIILGLAILAVDFVWARKALEKMKSAGKRFGRRVVRGEKTDWKSRS